ncbi:MAG: LptF/LptG family permease [Flavobacteriaceae bacterium]|uniref:Permease n=1 Tax=Elizabethkingia ursingii TaxID=1756150 RepID=A0ABX3NA70_9FLAO|nr:LptF/LptG family permease [Elizabethkingia ursingii]MDR2228056.1 LptF/LptG family permease [Flavobacteriaceae bacterium]OPB86266.1 permease [Elizabethkingia ursingii]
MKIIDKYIILKFLGTLGFMLALLSIIVLVIDVQAKIPRIESNGFTTSYFLIHFYPYWLIYLVITFMSILVFISVIFFTSRMANNTEIVAIISSGASFHRFAKPYLIAALLLAFSALAINHFILPWANIKKNKLIIYTYSAANRSKFTDSRQISTQLSPTEYVFINSYNPKEKRGFSYLYQKFDKNRRLIYQLTSSDMVWEEKKKSFMLTNYYEKWVNKDDTEKLVKGDTKYQKLGASPEEIFPDELVGENKTTPELIKFINNERRKGNANVAAYQNELHLRTAMPFSIIILTFLALSLSSQKKRGGLGANLAIGIALAFVFVFSFEVLKLVSSSQTLSPLVAMWLPNIVFAPIAFYLYWKRANQ